MLWYTLCTSHCTTLYTGGHCHAVVHSLYIPLYNTIHGRALPCCGTLSVHPIVQHYTREGAAMLWYTLCTSHCTTLYTGGRCHAVVHSLYIPLYNTIHGRALPCCGTLSVHPIVQHYTREGAAMLWYILCTSHCTTLYMGGRCHAVVHSLYIPLYNTIHGRAPPCCGTFSVHPIVRHYTWEGAAMLWYILCTSHCTTLFMGGCCHAVVHSLYIPLYDTIHGRALPCCGTFSVHPIVQHYTWEGAAMLWYTLCTSHCTTLYVGGRCHAVVHSLYIPLYDTIHGRVLPCCGTLSVHPIVQHYTWEGAAMLWYTLCTSHCTTLYMGGCCHAVVHSLYIPLYNTIHGRTLTCCGTFSVHPIVQHYTWEGAAMLWYTLCTSHCTTLYMGGCFHAVVHFLYIPLYDTIHGRVLPCCGTLSVHPTVRHYTWEGAAMLWYTFCTSHCTTLYMGGCCHAVVHSLYIPLYDTIHGRALPCCGTLSVHPTVRHYTWEDADMLWYTLCTSHCTTLYMGGRCHAVVHSLYIPLYNTIHGSVLPCCGTLSVHPIVRHYTWEGADMLWYTLCTSHCTN